MWDNRSRDDDGPRRHCRATGGADRGARSGGTSGSRTSGGQGQGPRRSGPDCPSALANRETHAPDLRTALGTHGAAARPDRADLRGAREFGDRGRDRGRAGRGQDHQCAGLYPQAPGAPALPRASAASARGRAGADEMPVLRLLRKLGEDITETLEVIPRQWKVIQHVREKFTCRDCEKISQAPAPFHVLARGWAGPSLLAMILFEKFGQHQPLNRQVDRYAREGVPLTLSTLADQVGGCCAVLAPLIWRIERHVFAAERLHSDDTTVPVLAKGKTDTGRCWVYVRDDRPFGGPAPPAAMFYYSRDRSGEHPQAHLEEYAGIFQADAYGGYTKLYEADRKPGRLVEAACWVHARRPFFILADVAANARRKAQGKIASPISPLALEAVHRIDALFDIERSINGQSAEQRRAVRQELSTPLVADLEQWLREQRPKLSRGNDLAKAMDYMLKRWPAFTRF